MSHVECPHCSDRVELREDGSCPSCGQLVRTDDLPRAHSEEVAAPAPVTAVVVADGTEPVLAEVVAPRPTSPAFGFLTAFGWCLILLLAQFLAGCLLGLGLGVFGSVGGFIDSLMANQALVLVLYLAAGDLIMLAIGWNQLKPQPARKLALGRIRASHVVLICLLVLPLSVVCEDINNRAGRLLELVTASAESLAASEVAQRLPAAFAAGSVFEDAFDVIAGLPWWGLFLVGALLPGVCEEVFFRGFLGRGLLARYGTARGVAFTSLLFAAVHIDPTQMCYTLLMGVVLHCVYLWTRTLWAAMLLHTLFNGVGFSVRKLSLEGTLIFNGPGDTLVIPPLVSLAALAAIVALIYLLYRSRAYIPSSGTEDAAWSPGDVTVELPPTWFKGAARYGSPGLVPAGAVVLSYLVFVAAFIYAVSTWFDPHSAWGYLNRGSVHAERDEYEQALLDYSRAIEMDPRLVDAYLGRAEANRLLGNYSVALDDYEQALKLAPDSAWAYADRAETYRLLERLDEALADAEQAVQLDPRFAWGYSVRGSVLQDREEWRRAEADLQQSLRLDPLHAFTHYLLAWQLVYCPEEQFQDARRAERHARRACELTDWSDPYMMATLAGACAAEGRLEEAIRYQRDALRVAPPGERDEFQEDLELYRSEWAGNGTADG